MPTSVTDPATSPTRLCRTRAPRNLVAANRSSSTTRNEGTTRQRPHGTRAKYSVEKCHCPRCRAANAAYELRRVRNKAYGRHQPYMDAGPVREHITRLQAGGKGWRSIAREAGLPPSTVSKILYGPGGGRKPPQRVRPTTATAILAVQAGPGRYVPATGTHRRLQALVAIGHPQIQLAARLKLTSDNFSALFNRATVTATTDAAVRELYSELWDQPPTPATGVERAAVTRAKARARARGWLPPMAWDDSALDDPAATPTLNPPAENTSPVVDLVAIDRALAGQARAATLTNEEFAIAVSQLAAEGATVYAIANQLGCGQARVRRVLGQATTPNTRAVAS